MHKRSKALFELAKTVIPGGVNSPVRSFNNVGGTPPFIKRGRGPYLIDEDDNHYIDYVASWGPLILGHAHPSIVEAVTAALHNGMSFGASTVLEIELAQKIIKLMPAIESIRMVNSGTEAAMSAIRLARGFTQRNKIIKFIGCYHGHVDALLVQAGSGLLTLGLPSTPGIPPSVVEHTLSAHFNDLSSVEALFAEYPHDIAAVIVEPVAGNMNCVPANPIFLQSLRELCSHYGSLLIFDEVITGFRVALNGAQSIYHLKPDLTLLGKVIGGGMPVGAFGGRQEIMNHLAPQGPVYQAGTLSGNPIAMTAGLTQLNLISQPGFFNRLSDTTVNFTQQLTRCARDHNIPLRINQVGSLFGLFFSEEDTITTYQQVMRCNTEAYKQFFKKMLADGVYFAPSAFESAFISSAHSDKELNHTLQAADRIFAGWQKNQPPPS